MRNLKGKMGFMTFDLGVVGKETNFTDSQGVELKIGDIVYLSDELCDIMVEDMVLNDELTQIIFKALDEDDREEFLKSVKEEMLNDEIMERDRICVICKYRDYGSSCVLGYGDLLNDGSLENIAKATSCITKMDMTIEEYIDSDSNSGRVFIEEA